MVMFVMNNEGGKVYGRGSNTKAFRRCEDDGCNK